MFVNVDGNNPIENEKLMIQRRKERIATTMSLSRQKGWDLVQ